LRLLRGRARSAARELDHALARTDAERFGWNQRHQKPGQMRDGQWLIGMGVAAAFRNNLLAKSAARVRVDNRGIVKG
jgi:xanthine dehydrogenase YagR molybdenum-binding subunit